MNILATANIKPPKTSARAGRRSGYGLPDMVYDEYLQAHAASVASSIVGSSGCTLQVTHARMPRRAAHIAHESTTRMRATRTARAHGAAARTYECARTHAAHTHRCQACFAAHARTHAQRTQRTQRTQRLQRTHTRSAHAHARSACMRACMHACMHKRTQGTPAYVHACMRSCTTDLHTYIYTCSHMFIQRSIHLSIQHSAVSSRSNLQFGPGRSITSQVHGTILIRLHHAIFLDRLREFQLVEIGAHAHTHTRTRTRTRAGTEHSRAEKLRVRACRLSDTIMSTVYGQTCV